ncbi:hypothetical protein Q8791_17255 [Nocardiopsis sp. CT-R113]|uniref:Uncharacterized protein n=1 Tax=Nocardiopsis codii TaxID=3065942 RepID=A0ABU7KBL9_9ACTN|nr:hypothetical protein [Nocardiopsis sp. CT-R113]MEE2038967.1 hypothetical protein [Nocardiopsis sp. CT-R113]
MKSLMFSIELASWSGERQLEWIRRTGFAEDEIVLQLEDFYIAVKSRVTHDEKEEFPEFLEKGIEEILDLFTRLIDADPDLWSPESMTSAKQWEVVRERAFRLLGEIRSSSWSSFLDEQPF